MVIRDLTLFESVERALLTVCPTHMCREIMDALRTGKALTSDERRVVRYKE